MLPNSGSGWRGSVPSAPRLANHDLMVEEVSPDKGSGPNCSHRIRIRLSSPFRVRSLQLQYFGRNSSRTKIAKVPACTLGFRSSFVSPSYSSF